MAFRPPSNQHQYDEYSSLDDAFARPPEGATKKKIDEYMRKVRVCRETADWSSLLIAGASPTRFVMRQVAPDVFRRIEDQASGERPRLGEREARHLLFRCALVDVIGLDDAEGKPVTIKLAATDYGRIATVEVPNLLDEVDPLIVDELGMVVLARCRGLLGKR